jgi:hypothetical protein
MDPDPDPGGPKTYGSDGSGSATLIKTGEKVFVRLKMLTLKNLIKKGRVVSGHR